MCPPGKETPSTPDGPDVLDGDGALQLSVSIIELLIRVA
jgi:hypothetical protein